MFYKYIGILPYKAKDRDAFMFIDYIPQVEYNENVIASGRKVLPIYADSEMEGER